MEARDIKKLYYSISEVSDITGLKQYVLRYWETEFSQLNPKKNSAGNRIYRSNDIDLILEIKTLLYDKKFTIKGAKLHLKKNELTINTKLNTKKIVKIHNNSNTSTLKEIKQNLQDLNKLIDTYKD